MSAGILENDTMMYSDRQLPWHRLGNPIGELDLRNIGVVKSAAGLNWRVEERTPFYRMADGTEVPLNVPKLDKYGQQEGNDGHRVLVRTDDETPLGLVGGRYTVVQNDVVFDIADSLSTVDQSVAFETAGSLRGGRTVWALARMGSDPRLDGLGLEDYLLVSTTHDGTSPILVVHTKVRVVCCNTLAMATGARGNAAAFKIKHTASADDRIETAKATLSAMASTSSAIDADILKLMDVSVTEEKFDSIIKDLIGNPTADGISKKGATQTENRLNVIRHSYNRAENGNLFGTGFGVVNAVNDLEIWASSIRSERNREDVQLESVLSNSQPLTQRAKALVLA